MDTTWKVRPYPHPAFARDVGSDDTDQLRVSDIAVLHASDDDKDIDIRVRVLTIDGNRVQGKIAFPNKHSAAGDKRFAPGLSVLFEERHVFRLERAT
jgi:hypothetical protein